IVDGITSLLRRGTGLKTLKLGKNCIGERTDAVVSLFDALSDNATLEYLDVSSNHIGPLVGASVSHCVTHNTTLTYLDMRWNQMTLEDCSAIATGLQQNDSLLSLHLDGNDLSSSVVDRLVSRLASNALNYRRRPALDEVRETIRNSQKTGAASSPVSVLEGELHKEKVERERDMQRRARESRARESLAGISVPVHEGDEEPTDTPTSAGDGERETNHNATIEAILHPDDIKGLEGERVCVKGLEGEEEKARTSLRRGDLDGSWDRERDTERERDALEGQCVHYSVRERQRQSGQAPDRRGDPEENALDRMTRIAQQDIEAGHRLSTRMSSLLDQNSRLARSQADMSQRLSDTVNTLSMEISNVTRHSSGFIHTEGTSLSTDRMTSNAPLCPQTG
ncbi:hypothetical protein KIPB_001666, partial [Kipferlia bialata]